MTRTTLGPVTHPVFLRPNFSAHDFLQILPLILLCFSNSHPLSPPQNTHSHFVHLSYVLLPYTMSRTVPASFDPFATHPFTDGSGLTPKAPQPYPYPRPIPTSQSQQQFYTTQQPSSVPSQQTPMSFHAPQPVRAQQVPPTAHHVFETFKLDRSSPDLQDILSKKSVFLKANGTHKSK